MTAATMATRVSIPAAVLARELDGETVILQLASGRYYGLDEIGSRMWTLIGRHGVLGTVLAELSAEYDAPVERLRADLCCFVDLLAKRQLLEADRVNVDAG